MFFNKDILHFRRFAKYVAAFWRIASLAVSVTATSSPSGPVHAATPVLPPCGPAGRKDSDFRPAALVRVTGDTVIRPHAEGAVRVQLRVGQAVTCRVCGIRDADIQIRCGGVNAGQPAGGAVAVTPGLARAADADEFAVVVPGVIAVILQAP